MKNFDIYPTEDQVMKQAQLISKEALLLEAGPTYTDLQFLRYLRYRLNE